MKTITLRFFVFCAFAGVLTFGFAPLSYAVTGPGSSWQYVRKITLNNATTANDFQVIVTLAAGQYINMNTGGSDIRFYDNANNICNYFIETWNTTGSSTIWVKVPVPGTSVLYMFYGNSGASSVSNADNTFIFYDHFAGSSLDGNKWGSYQTTSHGEAISVSGSDVTLSCGTNSNPPVAYGAQIISKTSFNVSDGVIIEEALGGTVTNRCGARGSMCGASDMLPSSIDFVRFDQTPSYKWTAHEIGQGGVFGFPGRQCNGSSYTSVFNYQPNGNSAGGTIASGTLLAIYLTSSNIYYYRAGSIVGTSNSTPPTGTVYPILSSIVVPNCMGGVNNSVVIDYIRVRKKYNSTSDITASAGSQGTNNLTANITAQTNVLCYGQSTGSATVTATGGTTPYSYLWSDTQSIQTATDLAAATFTVTVTDNIGLTAMTTATITQPASAVTGSVTTQTNVLCNGQSTGSVTVAGSGGVGPYTYALDAGAYGGSGTFGSLAAATYTVQVKDANGCIFDQPVTITQPTAVTSSVPSQTNISCYAGTDGTITVSASGGIGNYQFSVDNGGTYTTGSNPNPFTYNGLSANVQYKIRVKDGNGCESPAIP